MSDYTEDEKRLAREIALSVGVTASIDEFQNRKKAVLAAIRETTKRATRLAENSNGYSDVTGDLIGKALRNNKHLKDDLYG